MAADRFTAPARAVDGASAQALFAALQRRAEELGITARAPPPEPTTCCGRGCNGCVWEGFLDAAEYWRQEALLQWRARKIKPNWPPSPDGYSF